MEANGKTRCVVSSVGRKKVRELTKREPDEQGGCDAEASCEGL